MQQEPLSIIDAHGTQFGQDFGSIHELGDRFDPDDPGDFREAADRRLIQGIIDHVPDELAVDLQVIHRQVLEISERGGAGAKVIQGDLDSQCADLSNEGSGVTQVRHRGGFSDFHTHLLADAGAGFAEGTRSRGGGTRDLRSNGLKG